MKKLNWIIGGMMTICGAFFASCDDDVNNGPGNWDGDNVTLDGGDYTYWTYFNFETGEQRKLNIEPSTGGVPGQYTGGGEISVMGNSQGSVEDVTINITELSQDSLLVIVDTFSFSMGSMGGDFAFSIRCGVTKTDTEWTLNGGPVSGVECGSMTLNEVTLTGTIGTSEDSQAQLSVSFKPGAMPMPITFAYTSTSRESSTYAIAGDETSFDWHIAIHKYDFKTNGCAVTEVNTQDLSGVDLTTAESLTYTGDTEGHVLNVDLSKMGEGYVGTMTSPLNEVLSGWVTATPTGSMPPYTYELNSNVFVIRMADGQYAKVQFLDYSNDNDQAAYANMNYEYPLQ